MAEMSAAAAQTDELFTLAYAELRRLAARYLRRERFNHTLQPTALVHEAYLELQRGGASLWQNRAHFFGTAALAMRRVLVLHARRRGALKRGGRHIAVSLDVPRSTSPVTCCDVSLLAEALSRLEEVNPELARVVEVRVFGGLTIDDTASFLGISPRMARRRWELARLWLYREVVGDAPCRLTGSS
jgi:RNA polymerase sigma factor (TIGR02999 family)